MAPSRQNDRVDGTAESAERPAPRRFRITPLDLVDVLVYVVVLNLAVEYLPAVLSETFTLTLLTAVLLKLVLELVLLAKRVILRRVRSATKVGPRILAIATLLLVLPGSKFLVLELVALVFGDAVRLGGFFLVTGLIITLMLARGGVRLVFRRYDIEDRSKE
jgi:hypothetical protein